VERRMRADKGCVKNRSTCSSTDDAHSNRHDHSHVLYAFN
jgi:hypothetical protein